MLIGNGKLVTRDAENPYMDDGAVFLLDDKIMDIGHTMEMRKKYRYTPYIDAGGKVIMPGYINTHHHIYSAFARGLNLGISPKNFGEILEKQWWRIDKALTLNDVKYSAYVTLIECIKNGVTTVFDHHASPSCTEGSLFEIADAAKELGIRTCLCYEVSDRNGEKEAQAEIEENKAFIEYAKNSGDGMIAGMFGLHAAFTLSDKTLQKAVSVKPNYAGFHIHVAEGMEDAAYSFNHHGKRVVERLNDHGILGSKTIAVHAIHIDDTEIEILKNTDTNVAHNPESNMGNAVGCAPVLNLIKNGILTGLGTDGYTSDMCESMKVANILQKHNEKNPSVAWGEVPMMMFKNNAAIANKYFDNGIGQIKQGAAADIIIVDYNPTTPMTKENIDMHILFGISGRNTETVIINGKLVMVKGRLSSVDEQEIYAQARKAAAEMWKRV